MRCDSVSLTCAVAAALGSAEAASIKGMRFWNLTSETLSEVSLAPAGTTKFGPNQCKNDKDGTVEFDEQVAVTGRVARPVRHPHQGREGADLLRQGDRGESQGRLLDPRRGLDQLCEIALP